MVPLHGTLSLFAQRHGLIVRSRAVAPSLAPACVFQLPFAFATATMGRVRTKTVKKASRVMIERYYSRMTLDFQTNKKIAEEVAIIPSKRLRNKIAGFATHLMKRIQRGPVRGISLKLQEEERERRMDFVPEESAIKTDVIEVDRETIELLAHLNMPQLPGVVQQAAPAAGGGFFKSQVGGFQGGNFQGNRNRS